MVCNNQNSAFKPCIIRKPLWGKRQQQQQQQQKEEPSGPCSVVDTQWLTRASLYQEQGCTIYSTQPHKHSALCCLSDPAQKEPGQRNLEEESELLLQSISNSLNEKWLISG